MTTPPSGTITFLFTDIEGSTRLWQEQPEQMKTNLARHDQILRECIEKNEGYVFKTGGDGFYAAFATAPQGLQAAIEAQRCLASEAWGECLIRVRMGLHTGEAEQRDNDYFGTTLNRTARLLSAGHGGQILLSRATQELVSGGLPAKAALRDLGKHRLKDLANPEQIFQLEASDLPVDFPLLKTLDLQLNNLPTQLTHFVGRERETAAVLRLLRTPGVRLVTLTGPGGTGKTRISLQVAAELLDEFEHGAWFVDLATISDPGLFLPAVAAALKLKDEAGKSIADVLREFLSNRQLLLVLDNFEQIVAAAPKVSQLLQDAPKIKIIVTSREVLRVRGEHDYPVPPMGLPVSHRRQDITVLAQYEAISLFLQHARAANPAFEWNEENAAAVAGICVKLDGLPLALELAAARSRFLKPATLLEKLGKSLDMLAGGARDLPGRQQTIRAAISWSYELLDEGEKTLFSRLGIFRGGWSLEAAEAVCGPGLSIDVLSGLESLLNKSLIGQHDGTPGETRFTMLETIREFALEKLTQSGELPAIQQAHADAMEQFLQKVIASQTTPEETEWFTRLDEELGNLRSVMEWSLAQQKAGYVLTIGQVYWYWNQRSNFREPLAWLERGLALGDERSAERAAALNCAGNLSLELGEFQRARAYYEASLEMWRETGDANGIAKGLNNLGNLAWLQEKDYEKAQKLFEEVLSIGREPNSWGHAMTLNNLGSLAKLRGDYDQALNLYSRSRQICVSIGSESGVSFAEWFLGKLTLSERKLDEAQAHFENMGKASWLKSNPLAFRWAAAYRGYIALLRGNTQEARRILPDAITAALEYYRENPNLNDGWLFLESKARLELLEGHFDSAARLFGSAHKEREFNDMEGPNLLTEFERPEYEARIAEVCTAIGKADFEELFKEGQAMDLKSALAYAAGEPAF